MSVFTPISESELTTFLSTYGINAYSELVPIAEGSDNTNYKLLTLNQTYILTLFENISLSQAREYLEIVSMLANQGFACPRAMVGSNGIISHINQHPAALIEYLPGEHRLWMDEEHCFDIGYFLGRLHQTGLKGPKNRCNQSWLSQKVTELQKKLPSALFSRVSILQRSAVYPPSLPEGLIHADLFKDNAIFEGAQLSGVLDFYFCFQGPYIYDLMVTLNDWCFNQENEIIEANVKALFKGYTTQRRLNDAEWDALAHVGIVAAFRFWISRLYNIYCPSKQIISLQKDPKVFERRIDFWMKNPTYLSTFRK